MLKINKTYYIKGQAVVFLGESDVKGKGFFRELGEPNTFFSYSIYKVRKYPQLKK
jgi:hypothetical protein